MNLRYTVERAYNNPNGAPRADTDKVRECKNMSKAVIELEIKGDAIKFIKGLLEDYYYTAKNDAQLLEQYESLSYTISNEWRLAK